MVYTVFYKTSSFAGYCFLDKNSIHPKRRDVFNFEHFKVTLVKFQICSFIVCIPSSQLHIIFFDSISIFICFTYLFLSPQCAPTLFQCRNIFFRQGGYIRYNIHKTISHSRIFCKIITVSYCSCKFSILSGSLCN